MYVDILSGSLFTLKSKHLQLSFSLRLPLKFSLYKPPAGGAVCQSYRVCYVVSATWGLQSTLCPEAGVCGGSRWVFVALLSAGESRDLRAEEIQRISTNQGRISSVGQTLVNFALMSETCCPNTVWWICLLLQVFLKIEEKDVENALKDRTLLGSILAAGLPSWIYAFFFFFFTFTFLF